MDPQIAERMLADEETDPLAAPADPTPEEYTTDTHVLLAIADGIGYLRSAVIAAAGVDPPRVEPMPRPVTALDEIREAKRRTAIDKLIEDFTPR
ncbi:hypothetical protein ACIP5Y_21505 [Nocardia sp. NPDC088792]|uniref:hypothetical protein n=1 Tax=Nocardia sp. NPDC088792 TaxID=3364332 RepID=UPI00381B1DE4